MKKKKKLLDVSWYETRYWYSVFKSFGLSLHLPDEIAIIQRLSDVDLLCKRAGGKLKSRQIIAALVIDYFHSKYNKLSWQLSDFSRSIKQEELLSLQQIEAHIVAKRKKKKRSRGAQNKKRKK